MNVPAHYRLIASLTGIIVLWGCQYVPMLPGISTYRIDIQQGNVVTQDMVAKLKPGMTRQQVRFVMGTPPIVDPFRTDRWDYVYYLKRGDKVIEHRRLILVFDGEALKQVEGDVVAAP
jgi:outer membrane protein assembly factor BamE